MNVQDQGQHQVWVAYAAPEQQFVIAVQFVDGMTVRDAIVQSKIEDQIELPEHYSLGIFGSKIMDSNQLLQVGDRVEIYRALKINPKDIRRNRAAANPVGRYCRGNRFKQL
ncbi:RnfH family protein [Acinetobacter sp. ANC 3832]|uniref:RnfH family protein n=1 Tax=Acinetobacter sp. ANC 3832 TaxID=1977874 RepID=UPI000A3494DC|nr:RnfH family protein [Acinetobacter sp. ANC 3832]OTG92632.1 RnfH family protein [Acinetobacter sp. ANC 3832]